LMTNRHTAVTNSAQTRDTSCGIVKATRHEEAPQDAREHVLDNFILRRLLSGAATDRGAATRGFLAWADVEEGCGWGTRLAAATGAFSSLQRTRRPRPR